MHVICVRAVVYVDVCLCRCFMFEIPIRTRIICLIWIEHVV